MAIYSKYLPTFKSQKYKIHSIFFFITMKTKKNSDIWKFGIGLL